MSGAARKAVQMVSPSVEYIVKYGLPFLSLLTAPAIDHSSNKKEVR